MQKKKEIWKRVTDQEYEVSDLGHVRHLGTLYNLRGCYNKQNGYLQVMLYKNQSYKLCYVHKLVAEAFVENPHNANLVTHINNDYTDNRAENLMYRFSSKAKNIECGIPYNGRRIDKKKRKKREFAYTIKRYNKEGNCVEVFFSWESAALRGYKEYAIRAAINKDAEYKENKWSYSKEIVK